jgi:hypothetical protein
MAIARKKATEDLSFKERLAKAKEIANNHKKEIRKGLNQIYGEYRGAIPTKAKPDSTPQTKSSSQPRVKTLDDLKQVKELKDKIKALEARIIKKDTMIKSLKRRIKKLNQTINAPKKEAQMKIDFLVENPDFLEIM